MLLLHCKRYTLYAILFFNLCIITNFHFRVVSYFVRYFFKKKNVEIKIFWPVRLFAI